MKVRPIAQRPWYIGLISSLVVNPTLKGCGLTPTVQEFDREAHEASIVRTPLRERMNEVRRELGVPTRGMFEGARGTA